MKTAVRELEAFASTRVRQAGQNADRATGNVVAALFKHDTSRALDPHLHTHCIIFNATHDSNENRWKALQNYQMLAAQKFVENVYYHELARSLTAFGYTVENSARGDFRLADIPVDLAERFSKRHRQIDEQTRRFLAEHPEKIDGNIKDVREHLAHKLRSRKLDNLPPDKLKALWRGQLKPEDESSLGVPGAARETTKVTAATAVSWAEEHLFERRSVVREHELWRHALDFARGSTLTLANLKAETAGREYLRESNGELTRRDVLAREWRIVQVAKKDTGRFEPLASNPPNMAQTLADDQKLALEQILASRDFVTLFRGGAGTGKSYVLRSVQEAIAQRGDDTVVLAPQRQQVIDLQRDGLEQTQTLAEFLQRQTMPLGAIVLVDEAGQIGGGQMLALLELVIARNGRIILSGDTRQHGPVEASDALRAIERYSGLRAAELNAIRRQDPSRATTERERARITGYRDAVKAAAEGEVADSFAHLETIGAIIEANPEDFRIKIVKAYVELSVRGDSALVVSQTRAEVSVLNEKIREALRARGSIPDSERCVVALEAVDLTHAQKLDSRYYPSNHVVIFNRKQGRTPRGARARMLGANPAGIIVEAEGRVRLVRARNADHLTVCTPCELSLSPADRLQLKANGKAARGEVLANGEVVTVKSIRASGDIDLVDGRTLPASYRQFVRGYAVTSYGSQGKTVDHVLLGDAAIKGATNAQQWYVSISRGRKSVKIFTPDKAQLRTNVLRSGAPPLAIDLKPPRNRHEAFRQILLYGARRGRALARAISMAFAPKRKRLSETIKQQLAQ